MRGLILQAAAGCRSVAVTQQAATPSHAKCYWMSMRQSSTDGPRGGGIVHSNTSGSNTVGGETGLMVGSAFICSPPLSQLVVV